jgi:pilus assembly protein CpaB
MFLRRLMVALFLSLVAAGLLTFWLSTKMRPKPVVKVFYMAPLQNLEAGQTLTKEAVKPVEWPSTVPLKGAFTKPEEVAGRTLLYPVEAGVPLTDRELAASGTGLGLSSHIPDGMRALSLKSDNVTGVAGFLLPGSHVDVLVTYRVKNPMAPEEPDQVLTSTVLQDVPVLTAGQQTTPDPAGKPVPTDVVTLLVSPLDAQKATLASAQGSIHFILRNGEDHTHSDDLPTQIIALGGADGDLANQYLNKKRAPAQQAPVRSRMPAPVAAYAAAAAPKEKPYVVQTITGGK